ncbi:hypothetical protein B0H13DRAFT_1912426 [Mycena leptocephala]|nr:hypothetical protein B0H13DRAFT_1912426 [Mycena leptocephala]
MAGDEEPDVKLTQWRVFPPNESCNGSYYLVFKFLPAWSRFALNVARPERAKEYKQSVVAGKSLLYFPLHVNGNHWISFVIDFVRKVFEHVDPYGRKAAAKEFIPHLTKHLNSEFPGLGDILPHARQTDFVNCGIYAVNALEHVFKAPLICFDDCRPLRWEWFGNFVYQSLSDGAVDALLGNHNFPDLGPENFFERDASPVPSTDTQPIEPSADSSISLDSTQMSAEAPTPKPKLDFASKKRKPTKPAEREDVSNPDDSDNESRRRDLLGGNKRAKETQPRRAKTTSSERKAILQNDPHTVKLQSGVLKGTAYEVFWPVNWTAQSEELGITSDKMRSRDARRSGCSSQYYYADEGGKYGS